MFSLCLRNNLCHCGVASVAFGRRIFALDESKDALPVHHPDFYVTRRWNNVDRFVFASDS